MKHLVALACLPLALSACGTVSAQEVQLSPPPTGLCATAQAQALLDDLGAVYSDSPGEAADEFARTGGAGPLPTKGWAAYERQGDSVLLAAEDWRLRASRNPDKGWLIVESHICG